MWTLYHIIAYAIKKATNSALAVTEKSYKMRVILKYGIHRAIRLHMAVAVSHVYGIGVPYLTF
jgi:hypothetical protein